MDSLAPSPTIVDLSTPTRFDGSSSAMAVDSASPIDINIDPLTINFDTNAGSDIDTASTINVGIAVPTVIDTTSPETEVDIARSTIIDTASPILFWPRPPSTPSQARQEQFRRGPEASIWSSGCSTFASTTMELLS
jgi:hypothetical protein